jgi:hypothetical protein
MAFGPQAFASGFCADRGRGSLASSKKNAMRPRRPATFHGGGPPISNRCHHHPSAHRTRRLNGDAPRRQCRCRDLRLRCDRGTGRDPGCADIASDPERPPPLARPQHDLAPEVRGDAASISRRDAAGIRTAAGRRHQSPGNSHHMIDGSGRACRLHRKQVLHHRPAEDLPRRQVRRSMRMDAIGQQHDRPLAGHVADHEAPGEPALGQDVRAADAL